MTRDVLAGLLLVVGISGSAAAQLPRNGERVTVQGCLSRAERNGSLGGSIVGTTASPNTAPVEANLQTPVDAYLLNEATLSGAGASPTGRAVGTSGQESMTTYGLIGREAELERHQGARLEVVGTVVPAASSERGPGGAATASGARRLQIESFKVLAERCESR